MKKLPRLFSHACFAFVFLSWPVKADDDFNSLWLTVSGIVVGETTLQESNSQLGIAGRFECGFKAKCLCYAIDGKPNQFIYFRAEGTSWSQKLHVISGYRIEQRKLDARCGKAIQVRLNSAMPRIGKTRAEIKRQLHFPLKLQSKNTMLFQTISSKRIDAESRTILEKDFGVLATDSAFSIKSSLELKFHGDKLVSISVEKFVDF